MQGGYDNSAHVSEFECHHGITVGGGLYYSDQGGCSNNNRPEFQYSSALQVASFKGHQEIVRLLLDHGADINAQGDRFGSVLQAASFEVFQDVS